MTLFNSHAFRIFFITAIVFVCYSFMLGAPFKTLDDEYSVVSNHLIQDPKAVPQIFTTGYFQDHSYYRPLTNLTYWFEYQWHGLNPLFYNLDNVLWHATNAVLVYALMMVFGDAWVAFFVALLFALHPVQWESVSNISGRAILLSTCFSLIALITGWLAVLHRRAIAWLIVSLTAFLGALLAKESGVAVLVMMAGLLWVHGRVKRDGIVLVPYVFVFMMYLTVRHLLNMTETFQTNRLDVWVLGIISFLHGLIDLIRVLILPIDLHFDRSAAFLMSFSDVRVMGTLLFWTGVISFIWHRRGLISKQGWFWLGVIGISLLPVSQMVASIGVHPGRISIAEHFLYFASIGFFWWIVVAGKTIIGFAPMAQKSFVKLVMSIIMLFFVAITIEQNIYANNEYAMIKRSLSIDPNNARLQYSMGMIYVVGGNIQEASGYFKQAVMLDPLNPRYKISYGKSLCDLGQFDQCLSIYDSIDNAGSLNSVLILNRKAAIELKSGYVKLH